MPARNRAGPGSERYNILIIPLCNFIMLTQRCRPLSQAPLAS